MIISCDAWVVLRQTVTVQVNGHHQQTSRSLTSDVCFSCSVFSFRGTKPVGPLRSTASNGDYRLRQCRRVDFVQPAEDSHNYCLRTARYDLMTSTLKYRLWLTHTHSGCVWIVVHGKGKISGRLYNISGVHILVADVRIACSCLQVCCQTASIRLWHEVLMSDMSSPHCFPLLFPSQLTQGFVVCVCVVCVWEDT